MRFSSERVPKLLQDSATATNTIIMAYDANERGFHLFITPNAVEGVTAQGTQWWIDIWASPMAPEYDDSDRHGLFALAAMVDDYWQLEDALNDDPTVEMRMKLLRLRSSLMSEIRQQRQCFGLTPIDRRRLQWEIDRGDEAESKTRKRKAAASKSTQDAEPAVDPRSVLQAVP